MPAYKDSPSWRYYEPPDEPECYVTCCVCGNDVNFEDTTAYDEAQKYTDINNRICLWCRKEKG